MYRPVLCERLQGLDYVPFTRRLESSDALPLIHFMECLFFLSLAHFSSIPPLSSPLPHSVYCFVCLGDTLADPLPIPSPTNQAGVPPEGRCRGQTMQSLMVFMRDVEEDGAHRRCGSDSDVVMSAETPPAVWFCRAIFVRWRLLHTEIRLILLILEGKLRHFTMNGEYSVRK